MIFNFLSCMIRIVTLITPLHYNTREQERSRTSKQARSASWMYKHLGRWRCQTGFYWHLLNRVLYIVSFTARCLYNLVMWNLLWWLAQKTWRHEVGAQNNTNIDVMYITCWGYVCTCTWCVHNANLLVQMCVYWCNENTSFVNFNFLFLKKSPKLRGI